MLLFVHMSQLTLHRKLSAVSMTQKFSSLKSCRKLVIARKSSANGKLLFFSIDESFVTF